jgi:hypothetical protein
MANNAPSDDDVHMANNTPSGDDVVFLDRRDDGFVVRGMIAEFLLEDQSLHTSGEPATSPGALSVEVPLDPPRVDVGSPSPALVENDSLPGPSSVHVRVAAPPVSEPTVETVDADASRHDQAEAAAAMNFPQFLAEVAVVANDSQQEQNEAAGAGAGSWQAEAVAAAAANGLHVRAEAAEATDSSQHILAGAAVALQHGRDDTEGTVTGSETLAMDGAEAVVAADSPHQVHAEATLNSEGPQHILAAAAVAATASQLCVADASADQPVVLPDFINSLRLPLQEPLVDTTDSPYFPQGQPAPRAASEHPPCRSDSPPGPKARNPGQEGSAA